MKTLHLKFDPNLAKVNEEVPKYPETSKEIIEKIIKWDLAYGIDSFMKTTVEEKGKIIHLTFIKIIT